MGWSQQRLAAALGIPVGTLRNWEQGQQGVGNPQLLRGMLRCLKEHR
jgi:DNA-binding transcriptional regulator YiaG